MGKIKALILKYKEIIMYLIFGVATTVVSWGTYGLFAGVLNISVTVSNILSWVCAVLFAFVTNKLWVFDSKSWAAKTIAPEFVSFVGSRFLTGVIEIAGVPLLVKIGLSQSIFGTPGMAAKILVSVIVVILNYVFSKLLVFRKGKN